MWGRVVKWMLIARTLVNLYQIIRRYSVEGSSCYCRMTRDSVITPNIIRVHTAHKVTRGGWVLFCFEYSVSLLVQRSAILWYDHIRCCGDLLHFVPSARSPAPSLRFCRACGIFFINIKIVDKYLTKSLRVTYIYSLFGCSISFCFALKLLRGM